MKNLFILTELFYPNRTSTAHIMTEVAKYFATSYEVTVITTNMSYDSNVTNVVEEIPFTIERNNISTVNKNSFFSRIKGALQSSFLLTNNLYKRVKKGDKVLIVTNPFLLITLISLLRKFIKFEFILLVHDVFPENTVPAGLYRKDSFSYKILKPIFDWSYNGADKVIVLGEDMKQLMISKDVSQQKIRVIRNWFDVDIYGNEEHPVDKYIDHKVFQNKIVIGFAGNVGRLQGLDRFIDTFIRASNNRLVLLIIGEGAHLESLKSKSKNHQNIVFLGSKPREEQSYFLNLFDIGLISLAQGMYGLGVPSKSYNLLSLGKPILYIGDQESEIDLMIKNYNCGWSFNWSNEIELLQFLIGLERIDKNHYFSLNSTLAKNKFSKEIIMEKFKEVVDA